MKKGKTRWKFKQGLDFWLSVQKSSTQDLIVMLLISYSEAKKKPSVRKILKFITFFIKLVITALLKCLFDKILGCFL